MARPEPAEEELLLAAFRRARARFGAIELPLERFAERALERAEDRLARIGGPFTPRSRLDALRAAALEDLFLATACDLGIGGAWERLEADVLPGVAAAARRRARFPALADEVVRDLPGDLLAPPARGGARTRIGTFDGSGSLATFLAVIAVRRLAERARARAPAAARGGDDRARDSDPIPEPVAEDPDPASTLLHAERAGAIAETLARTWRTLTPREEAALALRYGDGLPQREIARLLEVGEPRVSRLLSAAVAKLRSALRAAAPFAESGGGDPEASWRLLRDALARRLAIPRSTTLPDPKERHGTPRGW